MPDQLVRAQILSSQIGDNPGLKLGDLSERDALKQLYSGIVKVSCVIHDVLRAPNAEQEVASSLSHQRHNLGGPVDSLIKMTKKLAKDQGFHLIKEGGGVEAALVGRGIYAATTTKNLALQAPTVGVDPIFVSRMAQLTLEIILVCRDLKLVDTLSRQQILKLGAGLSAYSNVLATGA